jgi:large subunit ribosomal protein L9
MEIILCSDVPDLGIIGQIVTVRSGYARNFLYPRGLAVPANPRNRRKLAHDQAVIEIKKQRERGTYERLGETVAKLQLVTEVRAGRGGKLFGSVTSMDVHRLMADAGVEIDRRRIELREPIKKIGEFEVAVQVGHEIKVNLKLSVKPAGGELEDASVDGLDDPEPEPIPEITEEASDDDDSAESSTESDTPDSEV